MIRPSSADAPKDRARSDVLIIHNIAWAHYKATVFSELATLCRGEGVGLHVVNVAVTEGRRKAYPGTDRIRHDYDHTVLWDGAIEETSVLFRVRGLLRCVFSRRPRVLIVSGYNDPAYVAALLAGRLIGAKVIVSVDSTELDRKRHAPVEFVKRQVLKLADAIFGYGTRSKAYCEKLGVAPDKIVIRCQATDHESTLREFEIASGRLDASRPRAFIFVGRLSEEKNIDLAVEAFRRVRGGNAARGWKLIIVGDGPLKSRLESQCSDLGDDIDFVGPVAWYEVPAQLARADVLLLPSKSEPWGLVVNEAMICGRAALVSSACGCAPDLIEEGVTGFQFDPDDAGQLASLMRRFVDEPGLAGRLGDAASRLISAYTPETAARQMMEGIRAVWPAPHGPKP